MKNLILVTGDARHISNCFIVDKVFRPSDIEDIKYYINLRFDVAVYQNEGNWDIEFYKELIKDKNYSLYVISLLYEDYENCNII